MSPLRTTMTLCLIEILGLVGIATFPALLPTFQHAWLLSHTEAGWISAVYFAGYIAAVPFLTGATDRMDARRILLIGTGIGCLSSFGFAALAQGFWSAALFRLLSGVSLAGIYMPGLKIIGDNIEGPLQSRYVSYYTASFGIGMALSFLAAGEITTHLNWRWAFVAAAVCAAAAMGIVAIAAPSSYHPAMSSTQKHRIDFTPVFKSKTALAYVLAYAAHMWELFGVRSWIVAFLTYSQSLQPVTPTAASATRIAFAVSLIGLPASILGNEAALRFGRPRTISIVMAASCLMCIFIGFHPHLPYGLIAGCFLLYAVVLVGDSAALTAGAVAAAPAGYRGTTLALHSAVGFGAAFLGPLFVGMVLDLFGQRPAIQWGMGFLCMAAGCAAGPIILYRYATEGARKK